MLWVRLTQIPADIYCDIYSASTQHTGPGAPLPPHVPRRKALVSSCSSPWGTETMRQHSWMPAPQPRCLWDTRGQQQLLSTSVKQGQLEGS